MTTTHERLERAGITKRRLETARDKERWSGLVYGFEVLSALSVLIDTWPEEDDLHKDINQ